jgi:PDZ domain
MALVACYECGGKVSTSAIVCPHCGAPSKQTSGEVTAEIEKKHVRDVEEKSEALDERASQTSAGRTTKHISKWILTFLCVGVVFLIIILLSQLDRDSHEIVSLIDSEGHKVSCPSKNGEACLRDAERKGFVKLSDAVAGIAVDANVKPLRIIEVNGTAAAAGVRKGDILIEIDGNEISEAGSILRIMSMKKPGDKLTVKVLRSQTFLYFAYDVMRRDKNRPSPSVASRMQSDEPVRTTSASASAPNAKNPGHEQLLKFNDEKRKAAWTLLLQKSGERCDRVTRTFFKMQDSDGRAYWDMSCVNGREYMVRINADADGSNSIIDCALMKRLGGTPCFERATDLPKGWIAGQ